MRKRFAGPAELEKSNAEVDAQLCVVRRRAGGGTEHLGRLAIALGLEECRAKAEARLGHRRLKLERSPVAFHRLIEAPERAIGLAKVAVVAGDPAVEVDGLAQEPDSRFVVAPLMRDQPEKMKRVGLARIEGERLAIKRRRLVKPSCFVERLRLRDECGGAERARDERGTHLRLSCFRGLPARLAVHGCSPGSTGVVISLLRPRGLGPAARRGGGRRVPSCRRRSARARGRARWSPRPYRARG